MSVQEIDIAYAAVHECLQLAHSLVMCIEETALLDSDSWHRDGLEEELARGGVDFLQRLLEATDRAKDSIGPLVPVLVSLFDEPARHGGKAYGCWHEAAFNVANNTHTDVWRVVDRQGFFDGHLNLPLIQSRWRDACRQLVEQGELPTIDDELWTMLRKEAAKAGRDTGSQLTKIDDRQSDRKSDNGKKPQTRRPFRGDARKVATEIKRRKKRNDFQSLEKDLEIICEELEIKTSPETIKRTLSDHPTKWK